MTKANVNTWKIREASWFSDLVDVAIIILAVRAIFVCW